MNLTLIAAISENNVLGNKGDLPWSWIYEDMKRFENLTLNNSVIMGRKTYFSIPENKRPLHDRKNIIVSNSLEPSENIYVAKNIEEALCLANFGDVYVCGGKEIYKLFLPFANKLELTKIHKNFEGDAFFPEINFEEWREINSSKVFSTKKGLEYSFHTYEKNNNSIPIPTIFI